MKGNNKMKKCPNCGHELPDDAKVCNNCGEPVEVVDDRSENKEKPKNESNPQPNNESASQSEASQSEAQKLKGEDADLVHEHLEPGLNIEAQKEIEKEDRTDPQNKEAEDNINNKKDGKNDDLADKSFLDY